MRAGSAFAYPDRLSARDRLVRDAVAGATAELRARSDPAPQGEPETFGAYIERVNPTLLGFEHVPRLVDVGQRIADGDLLRVLVMLAPQYFKTELFGRLLPAYYLLAHRRRRVGIISYGAELAWTTSEEARTYYQEAGGELRLDTAAKKHWKTDQGGQLWAAGTGGPLLGFGYELGVVDDPTDPEGAHSPKSQRRFRAWWPAKFLSRQGPRAAIVVVMQRLGIEDPIDYLLRREVGEDVEEAPEHWHIVICDEIRSDAPLGRWTGPRGLPPTCTLEPDAREPGEVLAPSYRSAEEVRRLHATSTPYVVAAQRQQRPQRPQGDFWRADWFGAYDELPVRAHNGGRDWDTAYTAEEVNSASACVRSFRGPGGPDDFEVYIHDVDWDWLEFPELVYWMGGSKPANGKSGDIVPVQGPHYIERRASGKSAAQSLRRAGVTASEVDVRGDKLARASGVQPIVAAGRVFVRRAIRQRLLEGERQGLLRVTVEALIAGGPDLDVNDAFVQAITRHTGKRQVQLEAGALSGGPTQRPGWRVE